ncbi:hypothetical protein GCM10010116_02570 [Microbispora rosea subsp. aerata]|nr:hypothetical protein GCM10010116_02570 [Microbispora rosea subsp. aerata]GLJ81571.1 hypothetical protein GCM10017588_02960 [Microbispora rosea subsp. aerata]
MTKRPGKARRAGATALARIGSREWPGLVVTLHNAVAVGGAFTVWREPDGYESTAAHGKDSQDASAPRPGLPWTPPRPVG